MMPARTLVEVETDLAALKVAAERAGTALACLFSSAGEFEAQIIRERRARGVYGLLPRRHARWRTGAVVAALAFTFLIV
jgi:hypothetical protein